MGNFDDGIKSLNGWGLRNKGDVSVSDELLLSMRHDMWRKT